MTPKQRWYRFGAILVLTLVLMEAMSVKDRGEGIEYNVFCYNVQPGISIDYATGDSSADGSGTSAASDNPAPAATNNAVEQNSASNDIAAA